MSVVDYFAHLVIYYLLLATVVTLAWSPFLVAAFLIGDGIFRVLTMIALLPYFFLMLFGIHPTANDASVRRTKEGESFWGAFLHSLHEADFPWSIPFAWVHLVLKRLHVIP